MRGRMAMDLFEIFTAVCVGFIVLAVVSAIISIVRTTLPGKKQIKVFYVDEYGREIKPEDDGRRLNGKRLTSNEDWDRWWTLKGFADGIARHLDELEKRIDLPTSENAKELLDEWFEYYNKYRTVCLDIGAWNEYVGDRKAFTANAAQMSREEMIKKSVTERYTASEAVRREYLEAEKKNDVYRNAIMKYLEAQPYHKATRHIMIRFVASECNISVESLYPIYRKMIKDGVLTQKKDESGHYEVRKARSRSKIDARTTLPPSTYISGNYAKVDRRTIYKVEYTVDSPLNVDRERNTCEFISKSSGERYFTSLEKCTCPVFYSKLHPCKHMVALAISLGYYDPACAK